jgi:hypothetical protein
LNKIAVKLKNRLILRLKSATICRTAKIGVEGYGGPRAAPESENRLAGRGRNVRKANSGPVIQFWSAVFLMVALAINA